MHTYTPVRPVAVGPVLLTPHDVLVRRPDGTYCAVRYVSADDVQRALSDRALIVHDDDAPVAQAPQPPRPALRLA